ncbi:hypothetical protein IWW50_002880 [Coemansia erecta]|nr:hypothetical protein GGF43_001397 [Coemansia sp. RSA 2618]KAJ2825371.1 hypothetical protein IWW50_002880 [Coemansia erecta]
MDYESLKFAALETAQVVPVTGCKNHDAVARHLHALGTTHAYRALGGMLSSKLIKSTRFDEQLDDYVHNEMWAHLADDVDADDDGSRISTIVKNNAWAKIDFFVLLTVYCGGDASLENYKMEVRVVINSAEQAAPSTIAAFNEYILALWELWDGKTLYFKGIEDYLLDSLPGVECSTRIQCLNYSMDHKDWGRIFHPGQFAESAAAQDLGLQLDNLQSEDIGVIQGLNVITYDKRYLGHCCPASSCIRRSGDSQPVAWGVCHADFQIGALMTTTAYRSRGLAKFIVHDIGTKMLQEFTAKIAPLYGNCSSDYPFKLQMVTELTNYNTRRLFERFGFKPVSNVSWAECKFDRKAYIANAVPLIPSYNMFGQDAFLAPYINI